ncbi:hypothetical protein QT711_11180 [Sporosarcina saromensis]|uniref:Uncharacterized protein n=1 Tax=Sporosarcina saromensis TaxID=359365 RepID=A0ABU4G9V6_9BACL|nr:hypothetical protein [Sporosarcina saromensis]MDW0113750.1 hypothetical protein [Sporosarcina saromensis]
MKNVMTRAWEIAKDGAAKFGGKVKEYFAQALVMAWAEIKKGVEKLEKNFAMIETLSGSRNHKTWVAEITGTHPKFKYNREFIEAWDEWTGAKEFKLYNGKVYEVCNGGNRSYVKVENGEVEEITGGQLAEIFA